MNKLSNLASFISNPPENVIVKIITRDNMVTVTILIRNRKEYEKNKELFLDLGNEIIKQTNIDINNLQFPKPEYKEEIEKVDRNVDEHCKKIEYHFEKLRELGCKIKYPENIDYPENCKYKDEWFEKFFEMEIKLIFPLNHYLHEQIKSHKCTNKLM